MYEGSDSHEGNNYRVEETTRENNGLKLMEGRYTRKRVGEDSQPQ